MVVFSFRAITALALLAICLESVLAFNPSWTYVIGWEDKDADPVTSDGGTSLWGRPHEAMTKRGVSTWYRPWFGLDRATASMDKARKEIIEGSKIVDQHGDKEAELGEAHCDDETLKQCHERLKSAKEEIHGMLTIGDVTNARARLGRVLHTLQDFYSHTNWVELGNRDRISNQLSRDWPLEYELASIGIITCTDCGYDGIAMGDWRSERKFDEDCRVDALFSTDDPLSAANKLAVFQCLRQPTLVGIDAGLKHVPPNCRNNLLPDLIFGGGKYLTSGYFGTHLDLKHDKPTHKCSHGGPFDRDASGREGIGKDTSSDIMSPHWFEHETAARLADKATVQYVDDLRKEICGDTLSKDCGLLRLLLGVGPTLSFCIDTTGSMGSVIAGVRAAAIKIVNERRASVENGPSLYVLAPFNDPVVPKARTFTDPDAFIAAISALGASGGDDCPELAMQGIQEAVDATSAWGQIFVWTDAAAKDAAKAGAVAAAAAKKSLQVSLFQFGTTGCFTPAGFDTVVGATGGKLYTGLSSSSASATAELATLLIEEDVVKVLDIDFTTYTTLGAKRLRRAADRSVSFDVPVDSTMSFVAFSLNTTAIAMTITRPDGSVLPATAGDDPSLTVLTIGLGVTYRVDAPAVGVWTVALAGNAAASLSVFAKSALQLSTFDFVEMGGARHDGLFTLGATPPPGAAKVGGHAIVEGPYTLGSATFEFRAARGSLAVLGGAGGMTAGPGGSDAEEGGDDFSVPSNYYYGYTSIPSSSFNVYVVGLDKMGAKFQRMLPGILTFDAFNGTIPPTPTPSPSSHANSTSSSLIPSSTAPFRNATVTCATCQPTPAPDGVVTTLVQTVVYYTSCPAADRTGGAMSTGTVTTTIHVPCYSACPDKLPVIAPQGCGCGEGGASGSGGGGGGKEGGAASTTVSPPTHPTGKPVTAGAAGWMGRGCFWTVVLGVVAAYLITI